MTQANISDAKEKFGDWVNLLKSKEQDEIILTEDGKPTIKLTLLENAPTEKNPAVIVDSVLRRENLNCNRILTKFLTNWTKKSVKCFSRRSCIEIFVGYAYFNLGIGRPRKNF